MARMINTVTGPVSTDDLGAVLAHEHVIFGYPGYEGDASFNVWDEERFFGVVEPVIEKIKQQGIKTIVDCTTNDLGRDVEMLKKVSVRCGVNIITVSGYYYERGGAPGYWNFRRNFGFPAEEEIYELMKREYYDGIAKTGIKAGALKVASGIGEITDYELMFFRAASRIAKEDPGVRIITHCSHGTMLKEQAAFFVEQGVNPAQVQLGHFCDTVDLSAQLDVVGQGFYAGFDRLGQVGFDGMPYDDDRFAAIVALTGAGFGKQIVLSNDRLYWFLGREFPFPEAVTENLIKEWHWTYIFEKVLPKLRSMGLSEEQVHDLMFENPKHFYAGA
ncbi:MAG: phosphotriesterase-related protein [Clostridiales Family XIII bacterium]|jgi:phosphotriesterase-related protein|nr:phosphotriesterase-related protein [Clostridiales Family XIII bacterium]